MSHLRRIACVTLFGILSSTTYAATITNSTPVNSANSSATTPSYQPISLAKSDAEREARFLIAYHAFLQQPVATSHLNNKVNANGDGKPTNFMPTIEDIDRFGSNAWIAYKTGHDLAVKDAIIAHELRDEKRLQLAAQMNEFALKYLKDCFTAGHIRTPRQELHDHITPSLVGDYLSAYMHDEENTYGVMVHNKHGDHWVAYGEADVAKQKILNDALKLSNTEIMNAFMTGKITGDDGVFNLLPEADEVKTASNYDISPLFYWDNETQKMMRRQNIANPYDKNWTVDWWGWSTLADLKRLKGFSSYAQAALSASGFLNEGIQYGLITDKNIIQSKNNQH